MSGASAANYKKLLLVAEAQLRKVELPQETITKYQELRESILSVSMHDHSISNASFGPTTSEMGVLLREEIINTQDTMIRCILDVLQGVFNKTLGDTVDTTQLMQVFMSKFSDARNQCNALVDENNNLEIKLSNKKWIEKYEFQETNFEKFMNTLEGIEQAFINKVENEDAFSEKVKILEEEIDKKNNEIQLNLNQIGKFEELKNDHDKFLIAFGANQNITLTSEQSHQNSEGFSSINNLTSFEILYKNLQDYSSFVTNFTEFFKEKATKYKATVDFSSKDDVLKWVGSLVTKMESDNKWLIDQVSQKDSLIQKMKSSESEYKNMWQKSEKRSKNIIESVKDTIKYTTKQKEEKDKIKESLKMHINSIMYKEIMIEEPAL